MGWGDEPDRARSTPDKPDMSDATDKNQGMMGYYPSRSYPTPGGTV